MIDMFRAFEPRGASVKLLTNHRMDGQLLFDNADRLAKGRMPLFER